MLALAASARSSRPKAARKGTALRARKNWRRLKDEFMVSCYPLFVFERQDRLGFMIG
jgi:hypothetical protein